MNIYFIITPALLQFGLELDLNYGVTGSNPLFLEPEPSYLIFFYNKRFSLMAPAYKVITLSKELFILRNFQPKLQNQKRLKVTGN